MILQIVVIVIAIFLILIGMFLLVPFQVFASGSFNSTVRRFDLRVTWLGITLWRSKPRPPKAQEEEKPKKRGPPSIGKLLGLISTASNSIPAIEIIFRAIKRAIRLRRLRANLSIGTGDPADTALLAGCLWSLSWIVGGYFPKAYFSIRPDLENASLEGSLDAEAGIRLLFLVVGILRAYSRRPFRQLISEVRRFR